MRFWSGLRWRWKGGLHEFCESIEMPGMNNDMVFFFAKSRIDSLEVFDRINGVFTRMIMIHGF